MSDAATNHPDDLQREIEAVRKRALETTVSFRGDGVAPGSVSTSSIANDAVTNARLANMAQATIKGRAAGAGTGDPTDLTANQAQAVLDTATDPYVKDSDPRNTNTRTPTDNTVTTVKIVDGNVTNAKLADMAQYRVKARQSSGTGVPEDVATDDLLVLADGSSSRRDLGARFGEVINAKDYGATGDGSTDDTSALVAGLSAAATARVPLYLPSGTYLTDKITAPANFCGIVGAGRRVATLKFKRQVYTASSQMISANATGQPFILGGFHMDLDDAVFQTAGAYGIRIQDCSDITLSDLSLTCRGEYQIVLAGVTRARVQDIKMVGGTGCRVGIYATKGTGNSTDVQVERCSMTGTHEYALVFGDTCRHSAIRDSYSEGASGGFSFSIADSEYCTIENCKSKNSSHEGFQISDSSYCTIAHCHGEWDSVGVDMGISINGQSGKVARFNKIIGNTLIGCYAAGICAANNSQYNTFIGNVIRDAGVRGTAAAASGSSIATMACYTDIAGAQCTGNRFCENKAISESGTTTYGYAEFQTGGGGALVDSNIIGDNYIAGVTTPYLLVGANTEATYRDGSHYYLTQNGTTRRTAVSTAALTTGRVALVTTNGVLTDDAGLTWTSGALTASTSLRCQASGNDSIAGILGTIYFATPASSYGALGYNIRGSGSANTWEYVGGDAASWLQFQGNQILCYVAASGSAGATISPTLAWVTDSAGKFAIGSDPGGSAHLRVGGQITCKETGGATLTIGAIADGEYLKRVGNTITSATVTGGSGNLVSDLSESAQSSAFTASTGTYYTCSGTSYTITLPTAASIAGKVIAFRSTASGTLTLDPNGSQTVGGRATLALIDGDFIVIVSDGSNWRIVSFTHADWTAFTPTITATSVDPTKGTRTETCYWRRDGHDMLIAFHYEQTAAGASGTGTYLMALPISASADTTIAPVGDYGSSTAIPSIAGIGLGVLGTSSAARPLSVMLYDATRIFLRGPAEADTDYVNSWGSVYFGLGGVGATSVVFTARVPISGW